MSEQTAANSSVAQALSESWVSNASYGVQNNNAPLLVAGDRLIGCYGTTVYAISLYTGLELSNPKGFAYSVDSANQTQLITSTSGALFFPSSDQSSILRLRLVDGQPLPPLPSPIPLSQMQSLTVVDDVIVVGAQDQNGNTVVWGIDAADGSTRWPPRIVAQLASGAVGYGDGAMFFCSGNQLNAVNTDFGDTRFPKPLAQGATAPNYNLNLQVAPLVAMTAAGNAGVVICAGDQVWGFDVRSGAQRWAFPVTGDRFIANAAPLALSEDAVFVAALSDGNILSVLDAQTGAMKWQARVGYAGTPLIAGDTVFVCGSGQNVIVSFDLATGRNVVTYALGAAISNVPPAIGNGHLYIQDQQGAIHAKPYASQLAAYFDGVTARVEVPADAKEFDFGTNDFTIEAWIKSSAGGEILCGHPTDSNPASAGFRLNLSQRGELMFAVVDAKEVNLDLAKSVPTTATDGLWHHIAVVRAQSKVSFFTDAIAASPLSTLIRANKAVYANGYALDDRGNPRRDLMTQPPPPAPVAISGGNSLFVGWDYYGANDSSTTAQHFTGLLREVRLWNKALDQPTIQSRQSKVLGPKGWVDQPASGKPRPTSANEPQLLGNWHLDELLETAGQATVANDVLHHEIQANFISNADVGRGMGGPGVPRRSIPSDLELDLSAFPYLLDSQPPQWPYASFWTTRGEDDIATPAALSAKGYVCFGTDNSLYGVRGLDGARQWGLPTPGHSSPIAVGNSFYVQTVERGLVVIDAATGSETEVAAFEGLSMPHGGQYISTPAASGGYLAAAAQDGSVRIANPSAADSSGAVTFQTGQDPSDLQFDGSRVCCIAGQKSARQLFVYDMAKQAKLTFPQPVSGQASPTLDSEVFALCGSRVFFTQGGQLVAIDTAKQPTDVGYRFTTGSPASSHITGLAAASDSDTLVVTTDLGQVYGLSMATLKPRWPAPVSIPDGPDVGKGKLNAPTIVGSMVFCTSQSGAVAALDVGSGRFVGLLFEPIGVITPATVQGGSAYFGCAAAAPDANLDGALHSAVFGDVVALRLGVDKLDKPTAGGYAVIAPSAPVSVGDDGECSVEAWINTRSAGGEILSIRPSQPGNVGLRLYLDSDGRLHFTDHCPQPDHSWAGVQAQTRQPTTICDGRWHHVAACRRPAQTVQVKVGGATNNIDTQATLQIYVDGVAQDVDTQAAVAIAAAGIPATSEIRIGASAYEQQPGPTTFFHGLIADVRLWDTYITADQVSDRMHTKLRGDEFSLLVAWDFSALSVHDLTFDGFDGTLAPAADEDNATFWLCDLSFTQPDYPDVTTTAVITNVAENTTVSGANANALANTQYQLTIACTNADRTPMPGALLRLWYVRHPGAPQPDNITLSTTIPPEAAGKTPPAKASGQLGAVVADQELTTDNSAFVLYTDVKGQAVVQITCDDPDHGPALDLSADFMPANERLHVNVLINNQKLAKPAPPFLMVQTKIIQDYHYSSGSNVDDSRSRNTYRAVITALNADHSPRSYEWLEISALDYTTIEVAGQSYDVNPHNAQTFQADASGQLTVVVDATDLKVADLAVWAGFMHQGERVTVALDQDAHQQLSDINSPPPQGQPNRLTDKNRLINWKKPAANGTDSSERGPLLKGGYENHAQDVSNGIAHVASAAQPSPNSGASQLGAASGSADRLPAMRQPVRRQYGDRGQALRTCKHVLRRTPVTPESVLASIRQQTGGDHVGFYMSFGNNGDSNTFGFGHFTKDESAIHMPAPRPGSATAGGAGTPLGNIFDSMVDAFESAADEIKKIAIEVGDNVTAAVQYADDAVVHVVINSIADAMEIIGNFLEKIALLVVDLIKFLLFLFDWGAILATHRILKDTMFNALDFMIDGGKIGDNAKSAAATIVKYIPGLSDLPGLDDASSWLANSADAQAAPQQRLSVAPPPPQGYSDANGVSGTMMSSKISQHVPLDTMTGASQAAQMAQQAEQIEQVLAALMTALPDLVTASPGDIGTKLLDIVRTVGKDIETAFVDGLDDVLKVLDLNIQASSLDIGFYIPFISELYKWVTGDDLTLIDATCLVLAVPTNIVYGEVTLVRHGEARHFNDDASNLPNFVKTLRSRVLGSPDAVQDLTDPTIPWSEGIEIAFGVTRALEIIAATTTDCMFAGAPQQDSTLLNIVGKLKSGFGAVSSTLYLLSFGPYLSEWMTEHQWDETPVKMAQDMRLAQLALGALVLVFEAYLHMLKIGRLLGVGGRTSQQIDALACQIYKVVGVATALDMIATLIQAHDVSTHAGSDQSKDVISSAFWCDKLSSVFDGLEEIPQFMFTKTYAESVGNNQEYYDQIWKFRLAMRGTSAAMQIGALLFALH